MAVSCATRATFNYSAAKDRDDPAEILLSLSDIPVQRQGPSPDERLERVHRIRTAIMNGFYRVRSEDIAQKLLDSMRDGAGLC